MAKKYWLGGMQGTDGKQGDAQTGLIVNATLKTASSVVNLGGIPNRVRFELTVAGADPVMYDYLQIKGTTNYDGEYLVVNVGVDTFDIEHSYVAETFDASETVKGSNWMNDNFEPCAVPTINDEIILDEKARIATNISVRHFEGKRWNLIDGIDRVNFGGKAFNNFIEDSGFDGDIGIDAQNTINYLHLSVNTGKSLVFRGSGRAYFKCAGATIDVNSEIPILLIDTSAGYIQISSDENDAIYASKWTTIKCLSGGRLKIEDATVVKTIYTYKKQVEVEIGINCVEVKSSNDPIDLYVGSSDIYTSRKSDSIIETEGALNFGSSTLKLINT